MSAAAEVLHVMAALDRKVEPLPTPAEFHAQCCAADFMYVHADDGRAYHRGETEVYELRSVAVRDPKLLEVFDSFREWSKLGGPYPPVPA